MKHRHDFHPERAKMTVHNHPAVAAVYPQPAHYPYLSDEIEQIDALVSELQKLKRWIVGAQRAKVNLEGLSGEPRIDWERIWCFNVREVEAARAEVLRAVYDLTEIDAVHDRYLEQSREAGLL